MAPLEPFEQPPATYSGNLLDWIDFANEAESFEECLGKGAVVAAYHRLRASAAAYPNTGEVLAALIGRDQLTGCIAENAPGSAAQLQKTWQDSQVQVFPDDWRLALSSAFRCPDGLTTAWLVSLDPYAYRATRRPTSFATVEDGGYLYPEDLDDLAPFVESYLKSGQPGAFAFFAYSMEARSRRRFEDAINGRLLQRLKTKMQMSVFLASAGGPKKHIGIVLSPSYGLLFDLRQACFRLGLSAEPR
jgi:hypothetical protein